MGERCRDWGVYKACVKENSVLHLVLGAETSRPRWDVRNGMQHSISVICVAGWNFVL